MSKEIDIHIWCKQSSADVAALYTLSASGQGLCYDLPLGDAVDTLREYLDDMDAAE